MIVNDGVSLYTARYYLPLSPITLYSQESGGVRQPRLSCKDLGRRDGHMHQRLHGPQEYRDVSEI